MRTVSAIGLLFVGLLSLAPAFADDDEDTRAPERLVIGLDLSRSNPLVKSQSYAGGAADVVADAVTDLPMASVVMIRTFGSYGSGNNLRIDRQISSQKDEKPAAVASLVREIVANVPKLVKAGKLDVQNDTNVVAFLENMAQFVDCGKMNTTVVLVSDGIEDSEYARLIDPNDSLPNPTAGLYRGCESLEIVGLGQGADSPQLTEHLRTEWERWAKAAGFKSFDGYNDW